jgi:hypothetical protein
VPEVGELIAGEILARLDERAPAKTVGERAAPHMIGSP